MKGPDGKMREMQNPLALLRFLLPGIGSTAGALGASTKGLNSLKKFFMPTRTGRAPRSVAARETPFTGIGPGKVIPGFERKGKVLTGMDRARRAGKIAGAAGGIGALGGIGSALLPQFEDSPEDTALEDFTDMTRGGLEKVTDFMTFLPTGLAQAPFRKTEDIQGLTGFLKGEPTSSEKKAEEARKREEKLGSEFVPTSDVMEIAQTQEEQFAKMQEDAAAREKFYYDALSDGGPDKLRALGDAFTNFGALYDEDKVSAIAGFNQGITGELDRDAAIGDEARRMALSDVIGDEAELKQDAKAIESAKNSIMTNPDLSTRQKIDAVSVFDSYLSGITETVPTNAAGNELNTDAMKANSVYLDPEKISGSSFVAVDRLLDIRPFNNKEEAKAHAAS